MPDFRQIGNPERRIALRKYRPKYNPEQMFMVATAMIEYRNLQSQAEEDRQPADVEQVRSKLSACMKR